MHAALAFLSGVVIEALYALGVIFIIKQHRFIAALSSTAWGAALLVGVNEAFKSYVASAAWCIGLGAGTFLGMWAEGRIGGQTERAKT